MFLFELKLPDFKIGYARTELLVYCTRCRRHLLNENFITVLPEEVDFVGLHPHFGIIVCKCCYKNEILKKWL